MYPVVVACAGLRLYRLDPKVAQTLNSKRSVARPGPKDKGMAILIQTEVPGVWMVAAGAAGANVPKEHSAFMRFPKQVSGSGFESARV